MAKIYTIYLMVNASTLMLFGHNSGVFLSAVYMSSITHCEVETIKAKKNWGKLFHIFFRYFYQINVCVCVWLVVVRLRLIRLGLGEALSNEGTQDKPALTTQSRMRALPCLQNVQIYNRFTVFYSTSACVPVIGRAMKSCLSSMWKGSLLQLINYYFVVDQQ